MFFIDQQQYTKYGFFEVGNVRTFSKYEAWQLSQQDQSSPDIKFNFNDEQMSRHDWTVEPNTGLSELYAQRAH